ncbi:MAG: Rpn family recombination-promoting nuclease/putative transposase [Oscillospiraceae bacterium]|nr:Rpn family recombination-promoting nuclease/putative transposase [Oscillospiraceae bacterium]
MRNDSIANFHKNMLSRAVFNLCDLHKSQPGRGKAYDTLLHSYQATICGYTLLPNRPSYINRVQLRFDDGQLFVEDVGIIFLELTKLEDVLKKPVDEMSLIEAIAVFFAKADDLRYRSMITALGRVREEIGLADELLLTISKDDIERAHYRSRRLFEMDRQSEIALATRVGEQRGEQRGIHIGEQRGINIGEQRGMQIGEQIGEQRGIQVGRIAAAIDAIRAGITSPTAIAAIAGITEDQAVSLIQEHKQNP